MDFPAGPDPVMGPDNVTNVMLCRPDREMPHFCCMEHQSGLRKTLNGTCSLRRYIFCTISTGRQKWAFREAKPRLFESEGVGYRGDAPVHMPCRAVMEGGYRLPSGYSQMTL